MSKINPGLYSSDSHDWMTPEEAAERLLNLRLKLYDVGSTWQSVVAEAVDIIQAQRAQAVAEARADVEEN